MQPLAKGLGIIGCVAGATFLGGFVALFGARLGGLESGGWNTQFLPPVAGGFAVSLLLSIIALAIMARRGSYAACFTTTLIAPLVITFAVSFAVYAIQSMPRRQAMAKHLQIRSQIKEDPVALRALIHQARTNTLSSAEQQALWDMVFIRDVIPADDVPFLLAYFAKDGSALGGLIAYQKVNPEQLRELYSRYKAPRNHRVISELLDHPLTPPDVLESLAEDTDSTTARLARRRLQKRALQFVDPIE